MPDGLPVAVDRQVNAAGSDSRRAVPRAGRLTIIACTLAYAPLSQHGSRRIDSDEGDSMAAHESQHPAATPVEDPKHTPIIDARLAELTARFGDRFDEAQRAQVRARIGRTVALAATLRRTALTNADEPEIVFVPFRTGGRA
jgi:hypothetical protein